MVNLTKQVGEKNKFRIGFGNNFPHSITFFRPTPPPRSLTANVSTFCLPAPRPIPQHQQQYFLHSKSNYSNSDTQLIPHYEQIYHARANIHLRMQRRKRFKIQTINQSSSIQNLIEQYVK